MKFMKTFSIIFTRHSLHRRRTVAPQVPIQLSSLHHGLALWDPKPVERLYKRPDHVSIGDVGYLDDGTFMRMFNVTLPWDDPSNSLLGKPDKYERIKPTYSGNVRDRVIREGEHNTPHIAKVDNVGANRHEE